MDRVVAARGRRVGRRPDDIAADIDQVEIAKRVLAKGRRVADRAGIRRDLSGAVRGEPRGALPARVKTLPSMKSAKK